MGFEPDVKASIGRVVVSALATVAVFCVVAFAGLAPAMAGTEEGEAGGSFVAGFEDLPLMPGLIQVADAGVVFDTPAGRIVEAYAEGAVASADVAAFYARTLPQLGWRRVDAGEYRREDELLRLEISGSDGPAETTVTVRFYLSPD
jgi:hypothetical protein